MRKLLLTVSACVAVLVLPALAFAATTVNVWHAYRGKENKALEQVAETYNKAHAEIQIKLLQIPYDAFPDKITAAIPRGKGPDLFIFAQDRVGDWAAGQLIEPLDFWLTDEMRDQFLEPTVEALTYDDQVFGLPMAFKMVALYYNTALVAKAPETTDEMIEMAKKATDKSKDQFGLVYENANFYYHAAWMQGFGGRVFDRKGRPTLDSEQSVAAMTFARDLAKTHGIMPEEVTGTLVTTLFNRGKAAFVINGPWFLGEIDRGIDYKVALLPTISGVNKRARPFLSSEGIIMSAKSADKKASFEVMTYLTSVEAGTIMATVGGQPSANGGVYKDAKLANDPVLSVFRKQLQHSQPMPNTPAMRVVWTPATTAMNKVINGNADPAEALVAAQAEVAKLAKGARR